MLIKNENNFKADFVEFENHIVDHYQNALKFSYQQ
jgi:hypothetical protein